MMNKSSFVYYLFICLFIYLFKLFTILLNIIYLFIIL